MHCKRGADRTGAVVAVYHIEHDRWENQRALEDAMAYCMSFFQFPRRRFIRRFRARTVEAGISKPTDMPLPVAGAAVKN